MEPVSVLANEQKSEMTHLTCTCRVADMNISVSEEMTILLQDWMKWFLDPSPGLNELVSWDPSPGLNEMDS